ncbi:hypothetical protein Tcan_01334, partial [Toxocara canis]
KTPFPLIKATSQAFLVSRLSTSNYGYAPHEDYNRTMDCCLEDCLFSMTVSEYESKVGRMYAFAQRMAGLNEGATNGAQLCDVVQSVVEKVRARVRSRCALIKCVLSLRSLKLFEEMQTKERNRYPM